MIARRFWFGLLTLLMLLGLPPQAQARQQPADKLRIVAAGSCAAPLPIGLAATADGLPQPRLTLVNQLHRYYVHAGSGCETTFEVQYKYCPLTNPTCSAAWGYSARWSHPDWGVFRSNSRGVARIDFDAEHTGVFYLRLRQPGTTVWSAEVQLTINPGATNTLVPHWEDYFVSKPGYTYEYATQYFYTSTTGLRLQTPKLGRTRIQVERVRSWCGFDVTHWRFTKDSPFAYWYPHIPLQGGGYLWSGFETLRWPLVASTFVTSTFPLSQFDQFIWGLGERRYRYNLHDDLRGAFPYSAALGYHPTPLRGYAPGLIEGASGSSPALNLGPRVLELPYTRHLDSEVLTQAMLPESPTGPNRSCPNPGFIPGSAGQRAGDWRFRIERVSHVPGIDPALFPDVIRVDFFEDPGDNPVLEYMLRESWFLAKDVGLIKIQQAFFGPRLGRSCSTDSDCLSDEIAQPDVDVTLVGAYLGSTPTVQVSTSATAPRGSSVCVNNYELGAFYDVWLTNTADAGATEYTGYLEARAHTASGTSQPIKWSWVDQGHARIWLWNAAPGRYTASFRIWAPNERFENESGLIDPQLPWSAPVTVEIRPLSQPCP